MAHIATGIFNHHLVERLLEPDVVTVLSGPSFAREVAAGLPTALTLAARAVSEAEYFAQRFHSGNFRVYLHDDLIGTQIGGSVKNVMAIATGFSDGLGYGVNARAALITRGMRELTQLGLALGGQMQTFMGLSGIGDLVLTCSDDQSRNRRFGLALAKGLDTEAARAEVGQAIEGIQTAIEVRQLAKLQDMELPITEQVVRLIEGRCSPEEAVHALLSRELKSEGVTTGAGNAGGT